MNYPTPRWNHRLANRIFGYDYFISFAHVDGFQYASALARELRANGRECFLDVDHYRIGDDWRGVGYWTLKRTTCLVVVGTKGALKSEPVLHELTVFRSLSNHVLPIDIDGTLARAPDDSPMMTLLPSTVLRLNEQNPIGAGPSEDTVKRILRDLRGLTQERKRARLLAAATFVFALLAIGAVYFAWSSRKSEHRAFAMAELANDRKEQAVHSAIRAASAASAARSAQVHALEEAAKAKQAAQQSASESASNWFARSAIASTVDRDNWSAFLMAAKAAETQPTPGPELDRYLSRAIHLADRLADRVINLSVPEGVREAVFSPSRSHVALVSNSGNVHVFNLPSGVPRPVPAFVGKRGAITRPEFRDDGSTLHVYLNWFHPEPDPEERGIYGLAARWTVSTGKLLSPIDDGRISWEELEWAVLRAGNMSETKEETALSRYVDPIQTRSPQSRGQARFDGGVTTVASDGRALTWFVESSPLVRKSRTGERLRRAEFVGEKLIALTERGHIASWNARSGVKNWLLPDAPRDRGRADNEDCEDFQISRSGSVVHHCDRLIDARTGRIIGTLTSGKSDQYILAGNSMLNDSELVSAWRFPWEAGDDTGMYIRSGLKSRNRGTLGRAEIKSTDFRGMLRNGRFRLIGSENSFRLEDWTTARVVSGFAFGDSSRLPATLAQQLLIQAISIERDPTNNQVEIGLAGGGQTPCGGRGQDHLQFPS